MKFTAFNKTTGEVLYSGTADNPLALENDIEGILEGVVHPCTGWLDGVAFIEQPSKPSKHHTWSWGAKQWEDPRTLADFKTAQWTQIKQARSQAEYAGFTWDGSTFDSDATSQNRITGAVTLAQMSAAFSIDWTLADNTVRTLNQGEMLQVGAALGAHVAMQFAHAQALRLAIEAATTREQVEAVGW